MEFKPGQMVLSTKGNGRITKLVGKENFDMWMAMNTQETGRTSKLMDMGFTFISTVLGMKVTGRTIYNMGKALNNGLTDRNTKDFTMKGKRTV